jgi:general secretion pathway protein B
MSFVLEALRKSEQERQQSETTRTGLLAPAVVEQRAVSGVSPLLLVAVAAAVIAAALWFALRPQTGPQTAAAPPATPAVPAINPGEAKVDTAAPAPTALPSPESPTRPVARAAPPPLPARTVDNVVAPTPKVFLAKPAVVAIPAKPRAAQLPKSATTATAPSAPQASPDTPPLAATVAEPTIVALPHETRSGDPRGLPTMNIAGYIHDEQEGSIAMINDKLVREGEEVSPGLRLEKILSDGAIFSYKGQRFRR